MGSKLDYTLRLDLSCMNGAEIIEREDRFGRTVKGVFVPIDENEGKNGKGGRAIFKFKMMTNTNSARYYSHWVFQRFSREFEQHIREIGLRENLIGSAWKNGVIADDNEKRY